VGGFDGVVDLLKRHSGIIWGPGQSFGPGVGRRIEGGHCQEFAMQEDHSAEGKTSGWMVRGISTKRFWCGRIIGAIFGRHSGIVWDPGAGRRIALRRVMPGATQLTFSSPP